MVNKMFLRLIRGPPRALVSANVRQFGLFDRIFKKDKKESTVVEDKTQEE